MDLSEDERGHCAALTAARVWAGLISAADRKHEGTPCCCCCFLLLLLPLDLESLYHCSFVRATCVNCVCMSAFVFADRMLRAAREGYGYDDEYLSDDSDLLLPELAPTDAQPLLQLSVSGAAAAGAGAAEGASTLFMSVDEDSQSLMGLIKRTSTVTAAALSDRTSVCLTVFDIINIIVRIGLGSRVDPLTRVPSAGAAVVAQAPSSVSHGGVSLSTPQSGASFMRRQSFLERNKDRLHKMAAVSLPAEARTFVFKQDTQQQPQPAGAVQRPPQVQEPVSAAPLQRTGSLLGLLARKNHFESLESR